jgi:MFS family permease
MVAIPVGALLGGVLASRLGYRLTAVLGLLVAIVCFVLMAGWGASELSHRILVLGDADLTLFALGLGFGMVIAPVSAAILDSSQVSQHGLASSLVVLARSTGMLIGLSALTALGLHRFYQLMAHGPAISFTPGQSTSALTAALNARAAAALLAEYHEIFLVAGLVLTAAAIAAVLTLGDTRTAAARRETVQ